MLPGAMLTGATNRLIQDSPCACDTELSLEPPFTSEKREAEAGQMLSPAHTAGRWQSWGSRPGSLAVELLLW